MRTIKLAEGRPYFPYGLRLCNVILFSPPCSAVVRSPAALCYQCCWIVVKLKWAARIYTAALRILISFPDTVTRLLVSWIIENPG
jgi:hypothetical protein